MRSILFAAIVLFTTVASAAEISARGREFAIDGRPVFLLGCSYYAGIGASEETLKKDLDELRKHGFNWIRVWATWAGYDKDVSAVDESGKARDEYFERLRRLVEQCDRRGMIVNVTLCRGEGPGRVKNFQGHRQAVEVLVRGLKEKRNWYLDLGNERNIRDARYVSYDELAKLKEVAKRLDEKRLITASHAGGDLSKEDLAKYLEVVKVDFVSVHRPREEGSAAQTQAKAKEMLGWMKELGKVAPLHFDEPFRRGYSDDWQPQVEDFLLDLKGAKAGGAAGWCFHNGGQRDAKDQKPRRSFDLTERGLLEQLDHVEREFFRELRNQNPEFRR